MSRVKITVYGKVMGKPRPRVTKFGTYTPKECKVYEKKIRDAYLETGAKPFEGEVSLVVTTHRRLPDSRPKKVLFEPDVYKPDADNIGKIVMDALNGVAYEDDKFVTVQSVVKMPRVRGVRECIEVEVSEVRR